MARIAGINIPEHKHTVIALPIYSNYGEKFAKVVRKVPAIKIILRPFMDAKRKSIGYKA